ncbi:hypothetical protein [Streptomyces sp. NPDC006333]|uniref:hypothetical protein n=1 Tax=Streptomyces sp. NPDC006333 TaxID=3156753 RepID=UPI0033AF46C6
MTRIKIASMRHQRHDNVLPPSRRVARRRPSTSSNAIVQAAAVIGTLCVTMYAAVELLRR